MAVLIAFVLCMLLVVLALEEEEWNVRASISVRHHLVQGNDIIAVVGAAAIIIVAIIALLLTSLYLKYKTICSVWHQSMGQPFSRN